MGFVTMPLTKGFVTKVDPDDYKILSEYAWHARKSGNGYYASRTSKSGGISTSIYMHRVIMDAPEGMVVDHINGDRMDNRKSNLRVCTTAENAFNRQGLQSNNTSGFVGVYWNSLRGKWVAQIKHLGKQMNLGYFNDPVEAAIHRDHEALRLHGEFAFLNFPEQEYF